MRELRLYRAFPGKIRQNSRCSISSIKISVTQLLDFFEHAPLLSEIIFVDSLPYSNVPAERMVIPSSLRFFRICALPDHSTLLSYLHISTGASVTTGFQFDFQRSPLLDHFPRSFDNLHNISPSTSTSIRGLPCGFKVQVEVDTRLARGGR